VSNDSAYTRYTLLLEDVIHRHVLYNIPLPTSLPPDATRVSQVPDLPSPICVEALQGRGRNPLIPQKRRTYG
jgi:hypothetical protein